MEEVRECMRHHEEEDDLSVMSSCSGRSDDDSASQFLEPPPQKKARGGARSQLWSPRRTEVLLQHIKHNFTRLTGKTERRSKVFADIAQLMQEEFPGVTSAQVEKKWRNLKQQFLKYKTERTSTGRSRPAPPLHNDLLESLMGDGDIVQPRTNQRGFPTPASEAAGYPPPPSTSAQSSHTPDPEVMQETRGSATPTTGQTGSEETTQVAFRTRRRAVRSEALSKNIRCLVDRLDKHMMNLENTKETETGYWEKKSKYLDAMMKREEEIHEYQKQIKKYELKLLKAKCRELGGDSDNE
ncbi:hypothetical protein GWK47_043365 [Chionoecetes opilio]|uniref:Myb/SANT-like DNA-binding domain-containing protein n=1 Tax=Chionoecetes opilio TaxID=41210 RepID=A0A8J4Y9A9_CHIOP|nr:hypothetical protein GWK47_043365 [Chionoecetes opilio]